MVQDLEQRPAKGGHARQPAIQDRPQGIDIGPRVHPARIVDLLGSHVGGSPQDLARLSQGLGAAGPRQAEVGDPGSSSLVEQHVRRLEVPVDDPC